MVMDGSRINLAGRLSRERTAALYDEHEARRRLADRGVGIAPGRPVVDSLAGLVVWLRDRLTARPHRTRLS